MAEVKVTTNEPTLHNEIEEIPIRVFAAKGDDGRDGVDGVDGRDGRDGVDGVSPTVETSKTGNTTTITITDVNGIHTATIKDGADGTGSGDMSKATYDTNNSGVVDNAEKVNNHTVEDDVPEGFFSGQATASYEGTIVNIANAISLKSVELKGDTYQQTYSVKNLLRNTFNSPSTVSGVTFTKNPDGTITASGTATAGINFYPNGNVFYPISEGTYTLSDGLSNPTGTTYFTYIDTNTSSPNYIYFNTAERVVTRTIPEGVTIKPRIVIRQGQTLNNVVFKLMLEQGSTATSFEPYVGGIPAPNPDYPQDVQVVTGEQTVKVTGKNLLKLVQMSTPSQGITTTVNSDGSITVSGTASSSWATLTSPSTDVALSSGETYTFSIDKELPVSIGLISSGVTRQDFNIAPNRTSVTATANYDNTALNLYMFGLTQNQSYNFTIYPQFEKSSSVTTYEPFQSQTYTVDLGSIELCKIGDYQDYIYKSGDDWYIHKEIGAHTFDGTESWVAAAVGGGYVFYTTVITDYATQNNVPISKYFSGASNVASYSVTPRNSIAFINVSGQTTPRFYVRYTDNFSSVSEIRAFTGDNNPTVYYALATATDTKITNTTLIEQLEALAGATIYEGINTVASSGNLPSILKIEVLVQTTSGLIEATSYTAGTGISIANRVITNTSPGKIYTAGTGISIANDVITNTSPAITYTAGAGISITNGVISCTFADGDSEEY